MGTEQGKGQWGRERGPRRAGSPGAQSTCLLLSAHCPASHPGKAPSSHCPMTSRPHLGRGGGWKAEAKKKGLSFALGLMIQSRIYISAQRPGQQADLLRTQKPNKEFIEFTEISSSVFLANLVSLSPKQVRSTRTWASEFFLMYIFICLFNFLINVPMLFPFTSDSLVLACFDFTKGRQSSS